jgi:prepilin-type N-terminal cleavage/methylation domain-containing protein
MRRGRHDDSGFTLIEVLVAFAIAAVLLLPLLQSFSTGIGAATRSEAATEATLIAQSALEGIGDSVVLGDGASIDRQEGRYHISALVRRYEGGGGPAGPILTVAPYEVSVTVDWQEGPRTRSLTLRTLRLGPPPVEDQNP